jgi:hypothetical protein
MPLQPRAKLLVTISSLNRICHLAPGIASCKLFGPTLAHDMISNPEHRLRVQDEPNSNFFCGNPNVGRAAEWM